MIQAFKDRLATGEAVLVVNPDHPSPSLAECLGRLPIDAAWIDCEQGAADLETVENTARYRDRGVQFRYAHANAFLSHGAADFADPAREALGA